MYSATLPLGNYLVTWCGLLEKPRLWAGDNANHIKNLVLSKVTTMLYIKAAFLRGGKSTWHNSTIERVMVGEMVGTLRTLLMERGKLLNESIPCCKPWWSSLDTTAFEEMHGRRPQIRFAARYLTREAGGAKDRRGPGGNISRRSLPQRCGKGQQTHGRESWGAYAPYGGRCCVDVVWYVSEGQVGNSSACGYNRGTWCRITSSSCVRCNT